jgi:hypothetical protein
MRDRRDGDLLAAVRSSSGHFDGEDDGARSILSPLNQTLFLFLLPEVGVRNDEADFRFGEPRHVLTA